MKKTQFIELIHLIRKTKVAFISVVIFIILSFAFYLGMGWTGRMTAESVDYYLNDHHVRDLEVISSLPISEKILLRYLIIRTFWRLKAQGFNMENYGLMIVSIKPVFVK